MEKRGLSQIVSTVLLMLIFIVAISIISVMLSPLLKAPSNSVVVQSLSVYLEIADGSLEITDDTISLNVKRNPGGGEIKGIKIILEDESGALQSLDYNMGIAELETKNIFIPYDNSLIGDIKRVAIAPVFLVNGEEKLGEVADTIDYQSTEDNILNFDLSWPPQYPPKVTYAYEWNYYRGSSTNGIRKYPLGDIDNLVSFFWLDSRNPARFNASYVKTITDQMPPNQRALFSPAPVNDIGNYPNDLCRALNPLTSNLEDFSCLWWEGGVSETKQLYDDFFREYSDIGGELDIFILDFEGGMSNWAWSNISSPWDNAIWNAIESDPRYSAEGINQTLISNGFYPGRLNNSVGQWGPHARPAEAKDNYLIWNSLMHNRAADYINEAVYDPLRTYFSDAKASNYGYYYWDSDYAVKDFNGHRSRDYGNGAIFGTHQSQEIYGRLGQITNPGNGPLGVGYTYEKTPFNAFRYEANKMRSMYLSDPETPITPWVSRKGFVDAKTVLYDSDYYQENILHAGLTGADYFLYWNPFASEAEDKLFSDTLKELDEMIGYDASRQPLINNLASWTDDFVFTGMQVGEYKVWRFTPNEDATTSLNDSPESIIFTVEGAETKTITFPGARIYESSISSSPIGYWIVQRADAPDPIVN